MYWTVKTKMSLCILKSNRDIKCQVGAKKTSHIYQCQLPFFSQKSWRHQVPNEIFMIRKPAIYENWRFRTRAQLYTIHSGQQIVRLRIKKLSCSLGLIFTRCNSEKLISYLRILSILQCCCFSSKNQDFVVASGEQFLKFMTKAFM